MGSSWRGGGRIKGGDGSRSGMAAGHPCKNTMADGIIAGVANNDAYKAYNLAVAKKIVPFSYPNATTYIYDNDTNTHVQEITGRSDYRYGGGPLINIGPFTAALLYLEAIAASTGTLSLAYRYANGIILAPNMILEWLHCESSSNSVYSSITFITDDSNLYIYAKFSSSTISLTDGSTKIYMAAEGQIVVLS